MTDLCFACAECPVMDLCSEEFEGIIIGHWWRLDVGVVLKRGWAVSCTGVHKRHCDHQS